MAGLVVLLLSATAAAGRVRAPAAARVVSSSLTQDAQYVVWIVRLDHPFSPTAMKRDHRRLCLVLERARGASVSGMACVEPPGRGGRVPRLSYMPVSRRGPGPAHAISAVVSRGSARSLTARFLPSAVGVGYAPLRWQVLSTLDTRVCTDRRVCRRWFPARPALARLHTPQVVGCVPSGSPLVYSGPSNRRVIALTFDDGPWPDTPQFLDVLEREHVHATFFQIGEQISTYGAGVERRMLADGDMIGDHTWSHANVSGAGSFAATQISMAADAIRRATGGFQPCLFRAPGGAISSALVSEARSMGFTTIGWDIDPRDWARPGTGAIYGNVIANAHPGAIVIQHDGGGDRSETLAALPQEIATLRARGYQFVTITELLGQRLIYK
jgi:peptidoglycan/xylan/chitin deacetylase (PgdA/CDA1 family)